MPGNEVADKVHNFFDQDYSSQSHQSQVGGRSWSLLNNNPWIGTQGQNGMPRNSNYKNYTVQSLDSERGNGRQSSQIPFATNLTQSALKPEFVRSQPRNQQINLNGFTHGSQGFQTRSNQAEFMVDGTVSDRNNLKLRHLVAFESQQGNAPENSSGLSRNSDGSEVAETPVNFDFLGGQQQLLRSQHPGMSQPRPGQQLGFNDMQLLQQHLMYKQVEELHRQQQLQQLDQGTRQQLLSQLSAAAKQAAGDQLPSVANGMPVNGTSNYMWPSELMGGDSRTPSSSQMFVAGYMNLAQRSGSPAMHGFPNGLMLSHDQGQGMQSVGLVPQQLDQSLHGTPISSSRGSLNHYSQFQGISHDCTDVVTKAGGNQTEKLSMQSAVFNSFQGDQCVFPEQGCLPDGLAVPKKSFQGKLLSGSAPIQSLNSGGTPGNFEQLNHLSRTVQVQESRDRQESANWSGNFQEKAVAHVGPSRSVPNLDPTEEKLLFSPDDDCNWDPSIGRSTNMSTGGYLHGHPLENNNYFGGFPSVQSGSWSALMQEAVDASSSDTGLHEEWSGLSFQKIEMPTGKHSAVLNDNGKQQMAWDNNNLQTSSLNSRAFPLFNDADAGRNDCTVPSLQQSSNNIAYDQHERVSADASHESFQHSTKGATKQLDQSHLQRQFVEGGLQPQVHIDNVPNGVWSGQMFEQSNTAHSLDMDFNSQNMQGVWTHRQNMPLCNVSSQPSNKTNCWNINESLSPSGETSLKTSGNDDTKQHAHRNDLKVTMHMESDDDGNIWKVGGNRAAISFPNSTGGLETVKSGCGSPKMHTQSSHKGNFTAFMNSNTSKANQELNQQILSRHQLDYGKHVAVDSPVKSKEDENMGKYQHQSNKGSSMNNTGEASSEMYDYKRENDHPKEVSKESYNSNHMRPGQQTDTGRVTRENSLLAGSDSRPSVSGSQKSSGQAGRKTSGPRRFQYHPMGNLGMNMEPAGSPKDTSYSQGLPQSVTRGLKNQEQAYSGHSQFSGHDVSHNAMDMGKGHLNDLQRNEKGAEETQSGGTVPSHDSTLSASFDGSAAHFSQSKRIGQTGQNMLELLHKVDQSRDNNTLSHFGFSDHNTTSNMHEATADGSASHLHHNQSSALQGFGLRLAPPSERQPVSKSVMPSQNSSQTANDFNSRRLDSEAGDKGQTWSTSRASVQPMLPSHDTSQREILDNRPSISGQKDPPHSSMQGNSWPVAASAPSYTRNQLQQQQHISSITGHAVMDQSVNSSFGSQADANVLVKHASRPRQPYDSHDRAVADQSAQGSLPSAAGRVPPFRLASPADTRAPVGSQFYTFDTGHSQPTNASSSYLRSSGQQLPVAEARSISQPSVASGMSQQGAFSTMLHNVWTNVSAQQRPSGFPPHMVTPHLRQSMNPLPSGIDKNSWAPQKADDRSNRKEGSLPSDSGTCSINSQQFTYGEEHRVKDSMQQIPSERVDAVPQKVSALEGQELVPKHICDGSSAVSISSLVCLHQQDLNRGKHGQDSPLDSQTEHISLPKNASSNRDIGSSGPSVKPTDVQYQNYALLQQMQAMKGAESDPSKRLGKRLKGAELGADASQMGWKGGQRFIYGQNPVFRFPVDNELGATSQHSSFPSDVKMLSFSSGENEEKSANTSSQLIDREPPSQDMVTSGRNDLQTHSLSISPMSTFVGGSERTQINPRMAPSWFEQYGTYKNGQILAMYDGLGNSQSARAAAQQNFFAKDSERTDTNTQAEQRNDASHIVSLWQNTSPATVASNEHSPSPSGIPSDAIGHDLVLRSKKRKNATRELLPWHKEVTQGSQRLQNISMTELDWAEATNRLIEKVEDEVEMIEDGPLMPRSRRRLILTTQLMQQLLPAIPAAILTTKATSIYESVAYFVAKLALGDACSLIFCSGSDSHGHLDSGNTISERLKTYERGEHFFTKVVEDFIEKSRKLESFLLRLDKRASILDIRVECQELERFSIINRFAKFHGRCQTDVAESSSASETVPRRPFPQRHVTALSMPGNFPEGVPCLSL